MKKKIIAFKKLKNNIKKSWIGIFNLNMLCLTMVNLYKCEINIPRGIERK
jgi:hypothetical protein